MPVKFGITFLPERLADFVQWVRYAEDSGFDIIGVADSQSLHRELYVALTLCALNTSHVRFGSRVTNPRTRHPAVTASAMASLEELAPGRTLAGVGTGDSALSAVGLTGVSLQILQDYVETLRALCQGERATYQERSMRLTWSGARIPIYISAHGPKTLRLAGAIADGVVVGTGFLPDVAQDSLEQIRLGAEAAGRDFHSIDIWWWTMCNVAEHRDRALGEMGAALAATGNHLTRFTTEGKHIPPQLMESMTRLRAAYQVESHFVPGGESPNSRLVDQLGLRDYLAERFAIAGTPDECVEKIQGLAAIGVNQIWTSPSFADKMAFMHAWSEQVLPHVA